MGLADGVEHTGRALPGFLTVGLTVGLADWLAIVRGFARAADRFPIVGIVRLGVTIVGRCVKLLDGFTVACDPDGLADDVTVIVATGRAGVAKAVLAV